MGSGLGQGRGWRMAPRNGPQPHASHTPRTLSAHPLRHPAPVLRALWRTRPVLSQRYASQLAHLGGQLCAEGVAESAGGGGQRKVLRRLERREAEPVRELEALEVGEGQQHEAVEQAGVPERAAVLDGRPDAPHHLAMTAKA